MAKPEKPQPYILPSFKIKQVETTLEKDGRIYARLIHVANQNNNIFSVRERTGLEMENYIDKPLECVVEITKAQFFEIDIKKEKKLPQDAIMATFVGWDTGYKFFEELVTMVDGETGDADDEDFDEDEYDILASKLFSRWGVYGFGIDVYRDKPMLKTEEGTFFLNEFIFEEYIDKWEQSLLPYIQVGIIIEELLLHGIKEFKGEWKIKKVKKETEEDTIIAKHNEKIIRGRWKIIDPY